ncbi:MAG: diguanylate cyclase [Eubacteriales bacterium]
MTHTETWQNFIETGLVDGDGIRPIITESWQRCRQIGIDPLCLPGNVHISRQELEDRKASKKELFDAAGPFVEGLFSVIQGSEFLIGLADENCCLLEVYGDQATLENARNLDVIPGADWNEDIRGNNAIGTAIVLRGPVQLTGAEHYLKIMHCFTCSGAPIYNPDGSVTGVLVLAAPKETAHVHTLGMVVAAVRAIEHKLALERQNRALSTVNHYILENSPHAIITVDNSGSITTFNKPAEELSGISCVSALGKSADIIFASESTEGGSFAKLLKSTQETGRPLINFQRSFHLPNKSSKLCSVSSYPLTNVTDDIIGVMAVIRVLNERKPVNKPARQIAKPTDSLSIVDSLTNLYNHKFFHERLEEEVRRSYLLNSKVSLIMLDIDYFKNYNDILGYPTGDRLLSEFANLLRNLIRNKDVIARYGGEEFAVILVEADTKLALEVAERIRNSIENYPFEGREVQPKGKISVSIGVATYPNNAGSKEELLKVAEEALYRAKHTARSKVALYFSIFDDLKSELNQAELSLLNTIKTLITVINANDKYTFGHSERVVKYSAALGEQLGLSEEQIKYIKYGAFLHDIGKIEIDRDILNKTDPLTHDEWSTLKCHPQWGADIVKPVSALKQILPQILYHHERFDGFGYPHGLKGTEIPLNARILTIADSFDAMTSARPYQKTRSLNDAVNELQRCAGTHFDPQLVEAFLKALKNIPFENEELVS